MALVERCQCCGSPALDRIIAVDGVPVENSRLYTDRAGAAAVARGDLRIDRCPRCGFVQNSAFDPSLVVYDDDYEDSQGHSPYFVAYAERLIDELIERFYLGGGRALEIGCGRGDFLRMFVDRAGGSGVGIDPSAGREAGSSGSIEIVADWFGRGSGHFEADLVMVRHTLEHIPDVAGFLSMLRTELDGRPEAILYIEVPDTARIATEGAFWDVYYEHCAYFDTESLTQLLRRSGFDPIDVRLEYEGQYLIAYARVGERTSEIVPHPSPMDFSSMVDHVAAWQFWVDEAREATERVAIWAASSKAVALLSTITDFDPVVAVDINPAKAGRYLPASATEVCHADDLAAYAPDRVLVMNPIYAGEIGETLASLGLEVDLWGMGPVPSRVR